VPAERFAEELVATSGVGSRWVVLAFSECVTSLSSIRDSSATGRSGSAGLQARV